MFCLLPGFILVLGGWALIFMFHSVGVHKVYLVFIHTNKWSATASTGNYVDFITSYNSFIITQFVLTICLACEGLSLDFAAIAANSTSFFSASMFELRDFTVWNKKQKHMKHKL